MTARLLPISLALAGLVLTCLAAHDPPVAAAGLLLVGLAAVFAAITRTERK